ncbi:hypothetical protein [Chryseobacterium sp.]|uniref:hypothetical protein n=1 Tax=Chryseobacterium sp. TaxID=1871047 RepID=UPI00388F08F3
MVAKSLNKIGFILIILFLSSCKKEKEILSSPKKFQTLEEKIYDKADSFIDSANCKKDRVVAIRYQKYNEKEFIQISAQDIFITDSLFMLKERKNHIIVLYNREFFEKILKYSDDENKRVIKKNSQLDLYKNNYTSTGIPCFYMYELIKGKLVQIPTNSYYYNNLFADPPMQKAMPPLPQRE